MALPCHIREREQDKFKETAGGDVAVRTCVDTSGGPVEVELSESGEITNIFDTANVASSATATVVTYTVPADKELELQLVEFAGENIATYFIEIDGVKEAQKRTWFGGNLSGEFMFNKLLVDELLVVRLRVENFRPTSSDFEGRILGVLNDK